MFSAACGLEQFITCVSSLLLVRSIQTTLFLTYNTNDSDHMWSLNSAMDSVQGHTRWSEPDTRLMKMDEIQAWSHKDHNMDIIESKQCITVPREKCPDSECIKARISDYNTLSVGNRRVMLSLKSHCRTWYLLQKQIDKQQQKLFVVNTGMYWQPCMYACMYVFTTLV